MTRNPSALPSQIGRYQILRSLGRGAMGQVLLAHDPVLDRPVAVKLLRDDLPLGGEQLAALAKRMEQEAKAAARVTHPNLVALHDMGRDPIAGLYLVFEYVEGETLDARLGRGPLAPHEAARLSRELGGALSAAHEAQIVHRDIKPENVLLAKAGAKIVDFGVARLPGATPASPGGLLGTPAYCAPEALEGAGFSPASDQFSLACTLFEALSAERAFPGDDAEGVAALVQTREPPALGARLGLHPRVDAVLARGLAKRPSARFASCEELGLALAAALDASAEAPRSRARRASRGIESALAAPRRRRAGSITGTALLGLAAVGAGFAYSNGGPLLSAAGIRGELSSERAELQPSPALDVAPGAQPASAPGTTDILIAAPPSDVPEPCAGVPPARAAAAPDAGAVGDAGARDAAPSASEGLPRIAADAGGAR